MTRPSPQDLWTQGPAKWAIAITTAVLGLAGLAWSIATHPSDRPATVTTTISPGPAATSTTGESAIERDPGQAEPSEPNQPEPIPPEPASDYARLISINTAPAAELELLPGIGPALASRIIDSRQSDGPFNTPADLERVRGIGPATRAKIEPLVTFE